MKHTHASSASWPQWSMPVGSFLRYNFTTCEMELVGRDGLPLADEEQQRFFIQLPEITRATLRASLLHCS